jgi:hypothetical protein
MRRLQSFIEDLEKALDHEAILGQILVFPCIQEGNDLTDQSILSSLDVFPADVECKLHELICFYSDVGGA